MSETKRANRNYEIDRYFLMDSQKLLSWRNPNYMAKFNHYILEEEINPITLQPATAEEIQTAEWYNHIHPITETLSWGTALYLAYVGYNQYYNKPYTTIPEAIGKGKDWIKGRIPSMGSQPVVEIKSYNMDDLAKLQHTENFTEKSLIHIFEGDINRKGRAGGYHYDMVEGTSGSIIEGTKGPVLNDAGIYEAKVEVNGTPKKANGGKSTFFPDSMSTQEVVDSINEAYSNKIYQEGSRGVYIGNSKEGIKIKMFLTDDGKIITAYPTVSEQKGLQMLRREYKLYKSVENRNALTVLYNREDYEIITTFMITEVTDFYLDVREALESVISGNMEEYAFDGNMMGIEIGKEITEVYFQFEEEILGGPCFILTDELYKLVIEWKEMKDKMYKGEDIFPLTIED